MRLNPFRRSRQVEERESLANPTQQWLDSLSGTSSSGVNVNVSSTYSLPAWWCAVRLISDTIASLPLHIYRRENDSKAIAVDEPLYHLLHDSPNSEQTAFQLRQTMQAHLLTRGNAYMQIQRDGSGRIIALWPIHPDNIRVKKEDGRLWYEYNNERVLSSSEILHIRGLGSDGIMGYSPIHMLKGSLGLALGEREYAASWFNNSAIPSGILTSPGRLSDDAAANLKRSWSAMHKGVKQGNKFAILEEGLKFQPISLPPEQSQWIESRRFSVQDIARIFMVPVHMLGELAAGASYGSIEQSSIEYVTYCIRPWLILWEQQLDKTLLGNDPDLFVKFKVDGLLRGDTTTRYNAYSIGRSNGWLSPNDIRSLEDMTPIEGGDEYLTPLNMVPLGSVQDVGTTEVIGEPTPTKRSEVDMKSVLKPMMRRVAERIIQREVSALNRAVTKYLDKDKPNVEHFLTWLTRDFQDQHKGVVASMLKPLYESSCAFGANIESIEGAADGTATRIAEEYQQSIASVVSGSEDVPTAVNLLRELSEELKATGVDELVHRELAIIGSRSNEGELV